MYLQLFTVRRSKLNVNDVTDREREREREDNTGIKYGYGTKCYTGLRTVVSAKSYSWTECRAVAKTARVTAS